MPEGLGLVEARGNCCVLDEPLRAAFRKPLLHAFAQALAMLR